MEAKFHITPDGPKKCKANNNNCLYGAKKGVHYNSLEEATKVFMRSIGEGNRTVFKRGAPKTSVGVGGGLKNLGFNEAEQYIVSLFSPGTRFMFGGKGFESTVACKPSPSISGECKTDVYVEARNVASGELCVFKISLKKENASFIENKIGQGRAKEIFGSDWNNLIMEATERMRDRFESRRVFFSEASGRVSAGSMTLGWRADVVCDDGGELTEKLDLPEDSLVDLYAGTFLPPEKKDSLVNGVLVKDSGVANFVLKKDSVSSAQDVVDALVPIEDYVREHPDVYLTFRAINYRAAEDKAEMGRPLAVRVEWGLDQGGGFLSKIRFDSPLEYRSNDVLEDLRNLFAQKK